MSKKNNKGIIGLAVLGAASFALGMYLSKKENREKVKKTLDNTNKFLKNKLDEFDYKYNIIPCDEIYEWNKDEDGVRVTVINKARSIEDEFED